MHFARVQQGTRRGSDLASTVTVKAVRMASSFSGVGTMRGSSRRSKSAGGMAVQMMPVVCSTMKAIACCVTYM